MTNGDLEKLVQMVLAEIARQNQSSKPVSKKVLAIFSGGIISLDDVLKQMQMLQQEGYQFEVVFTPNGKMVVGKQKIQESLGPITVYDDSDLNKVTQLLTDNEAVLVPVMTINTAAKIINGIADNLATSLIMMSLLSGKPVIAVKDACDVNRPSREGMGHNKAAQSYYALLNSTVERLNDYGIELCEALKFADAVQHHFVRKAKEDRKEKECQQVFEKRVLSVNDLPITGRTIRISPGTIITPAAKDVIKERDIEIVVC